MKKFLITTLLAALALSSLSAQPSRSDQSFQQGYPTQFRHQADTSQFRRQGPPGQFRSAGDTTRYRHPGDSAQFRRQGPPGQFDQRGRGGHWGPSPRPGDSASSRHPGQFRGQQQFRGQGQRGPEAFGRSGGPRMQGRMGADPALEALAQTFQVDTFRMDGIRMPYHYKEINPSGGKAILVVYLHGGGYRGENTHSNVAHGPVRDLCFFLESSGLHAIVVSPQTLKDHVWSEARTRDGKPVMSEIVKAFLDEFVATHRIKKNRIYIGGVSMGGQGTWKIISENPGYFAGALPASAAPKVPRATGPGMSPRRDPEMAPGADAGMSSRNDRGESPRRDPGMSPGRKPGMPGSAPEEEIQTESWKAFRDAIRKTPRISFSLGEFDVDDYNRYEPFIEDLQASGADIRYRRLPEMDHGRACQNAYNDPAVLKWIFGLRR